VIDVEVLKLDLRYEGVRARQKRREGQVQGAVEAAGQQVPIVVVLENGRDVVIDGFKRARAARRLGQDTVEATRWDLEGGQALVLADVLRRQARPSALEEAWLIEAIERSNGLRAEAIAESLGRSLGWVRSRIELGRQLPQEVQERVRRGDIDARVASGPLAELARANRRSCVRMSEAIAGKGVCRREAQELVKAYQRSEEPVRERLLRNPMLFLKARQQSEAGAEVGRRARTLLRAAESLKVAVAASGNPLADKARQEVEKALAIVSLVMDAPVETTTGDGNDRPNQEGGDPAAFQPGSGQPPDREPRGGLPGHGQGRDRLGPGETCADPETVVTRAPRREDPGADRQMRGQPGQSPRGAGDARGDGGVLDADLVHPP
jgi:hypothetical protein